MARKSMWLILLVCVVGMGLIVSACAKKQTVKVGVAQVTAAPAGVNPEEGIAVQKPAGENPLPAANAAPMVKPKEQGRMKEQSRIKEEASTSAAAKPRALDLAGLRIQFAFDDYSVSSKSEENLNTIAEWMKTHPGTKIQIQGYTCDIGTDEYNLALGDQRAQNAEKYLENLGVDQSRLSRISYGKEKPRVPNTDEANRSINRRDEFVMVN